MPNITLYYPQINYISLFQPNKMCQLFINLADIVYILQLLVTLSLFPTRCLPGQCIHHVGVPWIRAAKEEVPWNSFYERCWYRDTVWEAGSWQWRGNYYFAMFYLITHRWTLFSHSNHTQTSYTKQYSCIVFDVCAIYKDLWLFQTSKYIWFQRK